MVTPIAEIIFSGFVSKIVNNGVDASWTKIKKVIKSKKTEHQNMESQIYNIIVNALNQITFNKFKNNQDKIYQAAEKLLQGYNDIKSDDIEIFRSGLRVLGEKTDNDKYIEFKGLIYDEIGKKENIELYHTILLRLLEQKNKYDQLVIEQLNQKLDAVLKILGTKEMKSNPQHVNIKREIKSRTQEYASIWNKNMFLNDFDKRDENAGVNIKLSEVYLEKHLPHYIWKRNKEISGDIDVLLSEYVDIKGDNKMLLILGQPGIGKSTLITWITANFINGVENILVYRFASDLKSINWYNKNEKYSIVDDILDTLDLSYPYNQLNGKTLILDGFDEISIRSDRAEILNQLYWKLNKVSMFHNFSLIITCRENYIHDLYRIECDYITIKPWNVRQIISFCNIYGTKNKCNIFIPRHGGKFVQYKEVLGIPLILYMTLALNISIEKEGSIVDVYDKIFSLDGGIYERCIDNRSFADKHRIVEVKKQIHQISRDIAIWMFENKPDEAYIPKEEYEKICDDVMKEGLQENEDIKQDFKIGNYFKSVRHCEGIETENLYFVHRSIYEYFVAETIYSSIENAMITLSDESQEIFIENVTNHLKTGQINNIIGEYLKYKILTLYYKMNYDKRKKLWKWWENAIEKMMKRGMLYHIKGNMKRFDYIVIHEAICFRNVMHISSLISEIYPCEKFILSTIEEELLQIYIQLFSKVCYISTVHLVEGKVLHSLNMQKTVFAGKDYRGLYLAGSNFRESNFTNLDLSKSSITGANLSDAIMINANLTMVNFEGTNMERADLKGADLRGANLDRTNVNGVNLEGTYIEDSIWMDENIPKILPQLHKAVFEHIILQHIGGQERIHRDKLFSL